MLTYWYKGNWTNTIGNVGDLVTPIILNYLGIDVKRAEKSDRNKLLCVGSVLTFLEDGDTVWGSGLIQPMSLKKKKDVNFIMVRGKLTRAYLMKAGYDVPEKYGEPCFILPGIIKPKKDKKYKVGVVAHYIEENEMRKEFGRYHFINIMNTPERFIEQINECETIISSSLHGIVIAETYGIPTKWVQMSNKIIGGSFKFHDYYLSTGRVPEHNKLMPPPDKHTYVKEFKEWASLQS